MNDETLKARAKILVDSVSSYRDFTCVVELCAPNNNFPKRDYLTDEEQMTFEGAFWLLRNGPQFIPRLAKRPELVARIQALVDQAKEYYSTDQPLEGLRVIRQLRSILPK